MGSFIETLSDPIILTVVSLQLIWMMYAIVQLMKLRTDNSRRRINYYTYDSIPSTFVTIGLFGTCLGIAVGLYKFDINPENIKGSVQLLLTGLKSAFFVTILGLALSLVFKNIINHSLYKYSDIQPPESPELLQLKEMNDNLRLLGENISESFRKKFDFFLEDMKITNEKLINNLNSFGSTLANQNQQALIEALEGVVNELNTGFKEILGSLVKQNFQSLTDSVNTLNNWQKQNKVQVEMLVEAYTDLVSNTENFDKTLSELVKKNDQLVGQNSKLNEIIESLSKVLVDDKRFVEIIDQLNVASMNIADSAIKYQENFKEINNWFKQEHNIKESILLLNQQLANIEDAPTFNNRLSQTFGTLDKILGEYHKAIPRIIEKVVNEQTKTNEVKV